MIKELNVDSNDLTVENPVRFGVNYVPSKKWWYIYNSPLKVCFFSKLLCSNSVRNA